MGKSKKKVVNSKKPTKVVEPAVKAKKVVKTEPVAKKKNGQLKATIAGIAMIVAALGLGVGTYAYYQTTITGTVTGSITAWSFLVNDKTTDFTVDLGDLYPGVSGSVTLNLSAEDSGLGVNAVVSFSNPTNWPANLKLYSDSGHNSEIVIGTTTISRTITAGNSDTVTVYYDWPIGTAPETGPTANQNASFVITVVGTQVEQ